MLGIQSGHPTSPGHWWWVSVHTSLAMQLARVEIGSFFVWFVMVLVSLHPLHCHLKWKFIYDLKDTLKDVIVGLEEVKDRGIHVVEGPFKIVVSYALIIQVES